MIMVIIDHADYDGHDVHYDLLIIEEGGLWGCFSNSPVMVMMIMIIMRLVHYDLQIIEEGGLWGCFSYSPEMIIIIIYDDNDDMRLGKIYK